MYAFQVGSQVRTVVQANMRDVPGLVGEVVTTIAEGTDCTVVGKSRDVDGLTWWNVEAGGSTGWVAQAAPDGTVILSAYTLRLHRPCDRQFPVTQLFGERPEYYSQILGYLVPLKGHNGIDYGTPVGSPIFAADDGYVISIRYEDGGYGHHFLVGHSWGFSLYAHLSQILVGENEPVVKGQPIALSGDSGRGSGPHLHFGIKINPFSPADGWGGYSDPAPYMEG